MPKSKPTTILNQIDRIDSTRALVQCCVAAATSRLTDSQTLDGMAALLFIIKDNLNDISSALCDAVEIKEAA